MIRGLVAAVMAAGIGTAFAQAAPSYPDLRAADPARMQAREAVLAGAEAALAAGDAQTAADEFQRAAMMLHAADTEMGIGRAAMQLGLYRNALAFMAHTAGAHGEVPASAVLYAWLLRVGGQDVVAQRVLEEGLKRSPDDALLREARRALASPMPVAGTALLALPGRVAPQSSTSPRESAPPASARVAGSAVLLADGATVLVPHASLPAGAAAIWVRNGLGATRVATPAATQPLQSRGVTVLRLDAALDASGVAEALRDPFGGTPAFVALYANSNEAAPAWPWLRSGFVGAMGRNGTQALGLDVAPGPLGGPVLDASGRLAGIALPGSDGVPSLLPASAWKDLVREGTGAGTAPQSATRVMPDQAYETMLRVALQLIVPR